jgi:acetoacetyl-CoA synthetase
VNKPLWQPSETRIAATNVTAFMGTVNSDWETSISDSDALWKFSVTEPDKFWRSLVDDLGFVGQSWSGPVLEDADKVPGAKWFPEARFNFAENLLRHRGDRDAFVFRGEDKVTRRLSFDELYEQTSSMAQALQAMGIKAGDKIAGFVPNTPDTVIAMLAATSLGAIWSSTSPDFGVRGVLDRFEQIEPKVLFAADGYHYNGKTHDSIEKLAEITAQLPSVEKVIVFDYIAEKADISAVPHAVHWADLTAPYTPKDIDFIQLPFDHPLYIMFSSGTTGAPKCIIHTAGGSLLKHASEQPLHSDIKAGDRVFFFTTCGWMMWNWLVPNIAWGATVLLYDGSPFYPSPLAMFDYAEAENATLFGTSAKFLEALDNSGVRPIESHPMENLRLICSTGSPLAPERFDFVYDAIKSDVHLVSMTGGTDIMGCFIAGDPTKPVWRGELQQAVYGMDVDIFDDEGNSLVGEKGELVCKAPFPSVPPGFLNDPDGSRYHSAYFDVFPNIWCHGDFIERTANGGFMVFGRSDATLNPGGVRIGTAEIYRQVEGLDEVAESIVIGQEWNFDTRIILFVILADGLTLDDPLTDKIKNHVRANCTPRHVPAKVIQVADIPRTKSGKITELAVRDVVHGRDVKNKEALANAEALDLFRDIAALQS